MTRILIVRLGALGDIIHALPVLAALRHAFPDADVDWVVDARHAALFDNVEGVTRRLVVRAPVSADRGSTVMFAGRVGLLGVVRFMRQQHYDVALDLQGLIKSAALAGLSGAARVIGFTAARLREPQAAWFYTETAPSPADAHVVRKNLAMLPLVGVTPGPPTFPLRVPASRAASAVRDTLGKYVLINPGAAWPNKRWPAERFGELARQLCEQTGLRSIVLWGRHEEPLARAVVAAAGDAAIAAPATGLGDLLALASTASLLVSGDTGPLHVAAALGTPVVGLFGPTMPWRNGPWAAADEVVSRAGACVCFHKRACTTGRPCLEDVPVGEVLDASIRRLAREAAR